MKDLVYTHANPSFHHWRTEGKRFGMTFQSSAEAGQFEKMVKSSMAPVLRGLLVSIYYHFEFDNRLYNSATQFRESFSFFNIKPREMFLI